MVPECDDGACMWDLAKGRVLERECAYEDLADLCDPAL